MLDSRDTDFIKVESTTLGQFFAGSIQLQLPWFQRAYAWEIEQASRLLSDMIRAADEGKRGYALGLIRLARRSEDAVASLIDGHQRTITLTIIFALLRDLAAEAAPELADGLNRLIYAGRGAGGVTPDSPVFTPQPNVADFFARYVQQPGGSRLEPDGEFMHRIGPNRNVLENRNKLRDLLTELDLGQRQALVEFALNRCWLIVTTVADEDEAWAMLANEEETGLPFHASERSKITLISVMPEAEQQVAGEVWELWQSRLGSDGTGELLQHLRTLIVRRRSDRPVEHDLSARKRLDRGGLAFMTGEFAPNAEHLVAIKQRMIGSPAGRDQTGRRLDCLTWLDSAHWTPPLLRMLSMRDRAHPDIDTLVQKLDRLGWALKLAGADPGDQELRFNRVLRGMSANASIATMDALNVERKLARTAAARLREKTFYSKSCCGLVLRRLSSIAGQSHGPIDGVDVTVEHVMPRNPADNSYWRAKHSKEVMDEQINRLGNLLLVTQEENAALAASDYDVKRPLLMISNFKFASDAAAAEAAWTSATIERRTEALIATLFADLDLDL